MRPGDEMNEPAHRSAGDLEEIANLFYFEVCAAEELWIIDVLKLEGQRLVLKKLWA
jgi:hypothetical protein